MNFQQTGFIRVVLRNGRWGADLIRDSATIRQLRQEAGLLQSGRDADGAYDALLSAAGRHGYGLEYLA